jgi:hypothetical protein
VEQRGLHGEEGFDYYLLHVGEQGVRTILGLVCSYISFKPFKVSFGPISIQDIIVVVVLEILTGLIYCVIGQMHGQIIHIFNCRFIILESSKS